MEPDHQNREEKAIWEQYKGHSPLQTVQPHFLLANSHIFLVYSSLLRLLLRRHFFLWVRYVLMKDSIEKSARAVEFLRTKVSLLLPDYVPCRES